jgi:SP family myo-inositol transporter-like MFS transporter 13
MFVNIVRAFFEMLSFAIGISFEESVGGFRVHIGIALAFMVVQTVALIFVPESPRYLVQNGRTERAREVFSVTHEGATEEEIEGKVVELMNARKMSMLKKIREIHTVPSKFQAVCLICLLQVVNQFTGMDAILYYNDEFFGSGGWTQWSVVTCLTGSMGIIVAIPAYFLIDRMGRRFLLQISLIGCILMLIVNAAAASQTTFHIGNGGTRYSSDTNYKALRAMVTGTILYSAFYHFGLGIVPWMQSEFLPTSVRALGSSIACAVHWIGSFCMTAAFFKMAENMTPQGMYAFFIAVAFLGLVLLFLFYPELANRDLESIPPMLANGINIKQNIKLSNLTRKPTA